MTVTADALTGSGSTLYWSSLIPSDRAVPHELVRRGDPYAHCPGDLHPPGGRRHIQTPSRRGLCVQLQPVRNDTGPRGRHAP